MRSLSGLDASFVYAESPTAHMHTLKVLQLELPGPCAQAPFERVRSALEAWLPALPTLRLLMVRAPLWLGHPMWHEVREVDLDRHLERVRVDGDAPHALEEALSDFVSRPLERDRPLWRLLVVEGTAPRRVVLALSIHHALADGIAAAALIGLVTGRAPPGPEPPARPSPGEDASPSRPQLIVAALAERTREMVQLAPVIAQTARGMARRASQKTELAGGEAHLFEGPRVSFDAPVTPRRAVALTGLPFEQVRRIKERAGCRVNDVVLAIVAGALRRYLQERDEPLERPLVAAMPVGDADGESYTWGNRVSNLLMPIHVELEDPRRRLEVTAASATAAKRLHGLLGPRLLRRWSDLSRPRLLAWVWRGVRHLSRPPVNLIVSNVPGPPAELWVSGARLSDLHSVGPLLETTGLNITFWSYAGRMNACVLACPDHGTDVIRIAAHLRDAADELTAALEVPATAEGTAAE